jgi:hypothetical protein
LSSPACAGWRSQPWQVGWSEGLAVSHALQMAGFPAPFVVIGSAGVLGKCIARPPDILLCAVKEWSEYRQQFDPPTINDRSMHCIARDENQIASLNSPGLLPDPEPAPAFQHEHEFIVIWLNVDNVHAILENVDVAREVLAVTQERSLDRVRSGRWVSRETVKCVRESKKILWLHGVLLTDHGATE